MENVRNQYEIKEVYVYWPTGKSGPYNIVTWGKGGKPLIEIDGEIITIPLKWCEFHY